MKGRIVLAAGLLALATAPAIAQDARCTGAAAGTEDACQKALDLFQYMAPQLGTVVAGGNATLGQGGTLGGIGHFTIGIRANAIQGSLPNVEEHTPSPTGTQVTNYEPKDQILGLPAVDAAVGIFKGIPLGLTNVGGIDLLLSAWFIPDYSGEGVEVTADDGSLKIGYGARIGLLQESLLIPGVSATWMQRDLPVVSIVADAAGSQLAVNALDVQTTSWRIVASKSLPLLFGIAAGYGRDTYESSANITASSSGFDAGPFEVGQKMTRTNMFANLSMSILLLKVVGEIGQVSGGEIVTYNQFGDTPADDSRLYGSVGLRFGF